MQVRGAVQRPAHYELAETDDLADVLTAAGGFDPAANRDRLTIHRVVRPGDRGAGLVDRQAIDLSIEVDKVLMSIVESGYRNLAEREAKPERDDA